MRHVSDQPQLLFLRRLADRVPADARAESALRGERHLFGREVARRIIDHAYDSAQFVISRSSVRIRRVAAQAPRPDG